MAETTLGLISRIGDSDCARTYRILTAESASSIPDGEYIYFKAVFQIDDAGNTIERIIKNADGEAVKLEAIDSFIVLDYNFLNLKAIYVGDAMPADLKVYQF